MGLMDRLKETAQDVAGEARKASIQAQGKLGEVQLRRKMDDAARQLGYLVYRERALGTPSGSDADTLVSRMVDLDAQLTRQQEETQQATKGQEAEAGGAADGETPQPSPGQPMEATEQGAAAPQSPPEGSPTDQESS
jgi:hypothetical protein